jgi:hypothetical protein
MQMGIADGKESHCEGICTLTDGVFGVYGEVGGLGVAPFGEGGGGGRALVGGGEGREEEEDEEERGSHGSPSRSQVFVRVPQ